MDYGDIVINVFSKEDRLFYDLLAFAFKFRTLHHDDGTAPFALDLDIDAHTDDLPVMGLAARVVFLHLNDVI